MRINKCGNLKQSVRGQGCLGLSFCSLSLPLFALASFIVSDRLSCYPSIERCARDRCRIYRSHERRHILEAYGNRGSCKPLHGCQANKQHIQSTVNSGHWSPWTLIERNSAEVKITLTFSIEKQTWAPSSQGSIISLFFYLLKWQMKYYITHNYEARFTNQRTCCITIY